MATLAASVRRWGAEMGFSAVRIGAVEVPGAEKQLDDWLAAGFHGEMDYMARHGTMRCRPSELMPGARCVISARMNYLPDGRDVRHALADASVGVVSRYALGRDYHKVLRARLKKLAKRIEAACPHRWRVCTDSAPIMEVAVAAASGLGWRGKHSLLLDRDVGSYFFLGEVLSDLDLPADPPVEAHCGDCTACIDACPTGAIVAPYEVDARRCISYLTIELKGPIPEPLRPLIGNRIYGCDDCQLVCPWNRFAVRSEEPDFAVRNGLDHPSLVTLFAWSEAEFRQRTAGSAIHRIGYQRWLRNIAVALGNGPGSADVIAALGARADHPSEMVREHVVWALGRLARRSSDENIATKEEQPLRD